MFCSPAISYYCWRVLLLRVLLPSLPFFSILFYLLGHDLIFLYVYTRGLLSLISQFPNHY